MGDFFEGIDEISERVGHGHVKGQVEFDQVYAFAQHESTWLSGPLAGHVIHDHPGGGGAKYLEQPLLEDTAAFMQHVADRLLDDGTVPAMVENVEKLADTSAARAPVEFGDLRESAHPTVTDDGATVYDRPPLIPRLGEKELAAKAKGRAKGDHRRTYLPPNHPLHGTLHEVHGGTHSHTKVPKPAPTVGG